MLVICNLKIRLLTFYMARCLKLPAISLALFASLVLPAMAGDGIVREVRAGVLAQDVPDLWSGFRVEDDAVAINIEAMLTPSLPVLGGNIRPAIGGSIATQGGTSNAYIDARWEIETPSGIFFGVGLGATVHDGELGPGDENMKWLGCRVLFHIPAEIGYRLDTHDSVSVYFEHMSNAYTADYNEGLDRLGVRYGYRF